MTRFIRSLLFLLLLVSGITACNKEIENTEPVIAAQAIKEVSYGNNSAQKMDVYLPASRNSTTTKTLVFIHGGSWTSGDKAEFSEAIEAIKVKLPGYAMFNINYRLATNGNNKYPVQMEDIQLALDYIKSKSAEYKVNAGIIGLIGASAGAHLALLQAYKFNTEGKIKAVVDLFGPTDLVTLFYNHPIPAASQPTLLNFLGTSPDVNINLYQQASPVNFVTAQSVPTQIFHGNLDIINPISQSLALKAKLQASNVKVEMITYQGEGHGWIGNNLLDTYNKAVTFIQQNVQ